MSGLRKKKLIWSVRLHLNFGSGHQKFLLVSIRGSKIRKHLSHEILCFVKVARLSWDTTMLHLKLRTTLIWIRISAQFGLNQLSEGSKVHVTRIPGVASALLHMLIGVQSEYYSWKRKVVHNVQNRNMTKWTPGPQLLSGILACFNKVNLTPVVLVAFYLMITVIIFFVIVSSVIV